MDELGDRRFLCKARDDYVVALPISFNDPILSIDSESVVRSPPRKMKIKFEPVSKSEKQSFVQ